MGDTGAMQQGNEIAGRAAPPHHPSLGTLLGLLCTVACSVTLINPLDPGRFEGLTLSALLLDPAADPGASGTELGPISFNGFGSFSVALGAGVVGAQDLNGSQYPHVTRDDASGQYTIFYMGRPASNGFILRAVSNDGVIFSGHQQVMGFSDTAYDTNNKSYPFVLRLSDGTDRAYYTGSDFVTTRLLSAASSDGISWAGHALLPGLPINCATPSIVQLGSEYILYHIATQSPPDRIVRRVSSDGMNFGATQTLALAGKVNGVDDVTVSVAQVVHQDGWFYVMYTCENAGAVGRICWAYSSDGVNWQGHKLILVPGQSGTPQDLNQVNSPSFVILPDRRIRVYYTVQSPAISNVITALSN